MALDILHDNWGPYTHTEVENALKAYLTVLENRINQAIQSGGVGLADLSAEVQALLNKANTALQPENISAWAKAQNKPGYTADEITYSNLLTLAEKLADMDQKIQAAAQSGVTVDPQLADSGNPVANRAVKAAIDTLTNTLNTLIGSGNVQGAIDTFNEVVAFLNGINSSDTLAAELLKKYEKPQGGIPASDLADGIIPRIGGNGNWFIGNTDTGIAAQGPQGNVTITDGNLNSLVIAQVLNGQGDILGIDAAMQIRRNIDTLYNSVVRLYNKLANLAFLTDADKVLAAPTQLSWSAIQKELTITNNLAHSVIMMDNQEVSGSVLVDQGATILLTIAPAPGYELVSVSALIGGSDALTPFDNEDGTFTISVQVSDNLTLVIGGESQVAHYDVSIITSNSTGALDLDTKSVLAGGTFAGQVLYLNADYNDFDVVSVKDASNNNVAYSVSNGVITIADVQSDITITAIAKYQLKVWFGKSLNLFGGMKDVEGECVTDYIKMTGLTTTQATLNNGGLSKLGAFPLMNDGRCMLLYDSDKRLIYTDGSYEILRVSSYLSTTDVNPRTVSSTWLTSVINAAGAKTPLYARFTAKCSGTTINSAASFLQGGVEFFDKSNYVASTDYPTQHSLSYTLNNAQVDNGQVPTTFQHGQPLEIAFAGSTSSYSINNATIVVTMGGNTLTAGTDYTITSKTKSGTTWKIIRIENATGDINFNVSIA